MLIKPLVQTTDFVKGRWPCKEMDEPAAPPPPAPAAKAPPSLPPPKPPSRRNIRIKMSAHNPRFYLLADETDPHSRALVLRGLAMLEATHRQEGEEESITSVKLFVHALESYVNPDVSAALSGGRAGGGAEATLGITLIEPLYVARPPQAH